jgi:hypothetical protein
MNIAMKLNILDVLSNLRLCTLFRLSHGGGTCAYEPRSLFEAIYILSIRPEQLTTLIERVNKMMRRRWGGLVDCHLETRDEGVEHGSRRLIAEERRVK